MFIFAIQIQDSLFFPNKNVQKGSEKCLRVAQIDLGHTKKADSSKYCVAWPRNYYGMSHCQRGGDKNVKSPPTGCSSNVIQREET